MSREPLGPTPRRSRVGGWAIAAVLAVLALVLYAVRYALLPFVFAAAIGFVADPLIVRLQRRLGSPRWLVAALLYIVFLGLFGAALYWIGSTAAADLMRLAASAPQILEHFVGQLLGPRIDLLGHVYSPQQLVQEFGALLSAAAGAGGAAHLAGSALTAALSGFLLVVLVPYFLISGPRLAAGAIWLLPPERRPSVEALLPKLVPILRRYLLGLASVVLYTAAVGWIGFGPVFHLPHAPLLAIAVALLELVPVAGPLASATLVGLVAVQQTSIWAALFLIAFVIGLRLSIDDLVGPLVLGQAGRVHPVVVILSFVCGAMLFGIVGLLLAVPVAVTIKTTLEHYYAEPVRPQGRG
ncbi:MAG TPA: AI-2E family transporter [Stellaceae bacterium]|nr:AI-2E family transporter [Stellaceae bacterium]